MSRSSRHARREADRERNVWGERKKEGVDGKVDELIPRIGLNSRGWQRRESGEGEGLGRLGG